MKNHDRTTTIREAKLPLYAGIDVGGTSIKLGLVDDQGLTLSRTQFPTESEKGVPNAIERTAHVLWSELKRLEADQAQLAAVGLATPGTMDVAAGMILDPPNLPGWRHFPIVAELQQALGKPVAFANDANAAAFGESWIGRGREFPSLIMLTLGTGVGGGIIIGDLSIDGEHSHGSECGHLIIDHNEDARMCPCGQRGHLEAYASATALIRRAKDVLTSTRRASVLHEALAAGQEITPLLLCQVAEDGDALAYELIMELADFLGIGIASLVHIIDPGVVLLGGAMNFGGLETALGRQFLDQVRSQFRRRAFPVVAESTVIDFAALGGDAGYVGAAGIARVRHRHPAAPAS